MLARTDSAFLAVLAFVVSFVPAVFGSALLGGLADRVPRKVVLLGCDLVRAVVISAARAASPWTRHAGVGAARAAAGRGAFTAPFEAAQRAVVPDVLPEPRAGAGRHRPDADALPGRPGGRHLRWPALVIFAVGERAGLLIDAATFAVSVRASSR